MSSAPRLFLAVELPLPTRRAVAPVLRQLASLDPDLRPVRADGLHITLRFLGRVEPAREAAIRAVAARVASETKSFPLALEGMGTFPERARPRVLWAGVGEGRREISRLAESLRSGLAAAGWGPDPSPFRAHCTLARLPERLSTTSTKAIAEFCGGGLREGPLRAAIDSVFLLESVPVPRGPNRYPRRAKWLLLRS